MLKGQGKKGPGGKGLTLMNPGTSVTVALRTPPCSTADFAMDAASSTSGTTSKCPICSYWAGPGWEKVKLKWV